MSTEYVTIEVDVEELRRAVEWGRFGGRKEYELARKVLDAAGRATPTESKRWCTTHETEYDPDLDSWGACAVAWQLSYPPEGCEFVDDVPLAVELLGVTFNEVQEAARKWFEK